MPKFKTKSFILYPTLDQVTKLKGWLYDSAYVLSHCLRKRQALYEYHKDAGRLEWSAKFPTRAGFREKFGNIPGWMKQRIVKAADDLADKAILEGSEFPKPRGPLKNDQVNITDGPKNLGENCLSLMDLGTVKTCRHGALPEDATPVRWLIVFRKGKWFLKILLMWSGDAVEGKVG